MVIRNRYEYDKRSKSALSFEVKKDENGKIINPKVVSRTKQSEKDASDINKIVKRAKRTGFLTSGFATDRKPFYDDFTNGQDYLEVQNKLIRMGNMFNQLPVDIRNKFNNSPAAFLDFVKNPDNKKECIELGLLPKPKITTKEEGNEIVTYEDGAEIGRVAKPEQAPAQ